MGLTAFEESTSAFGGKQKNFNIFSFPLYLDAEPSFWLGLGSMGTKATLREISSPWTFAGPGRGRCRVALGGNNERVKVGEVPNKFKGGGVVSIVFFDTQ